MLLQLKCVFKHPYLQMFGLKLHKYEYLVKLEGKGLTKIVYTMDGS